MNEINSSLIIHSLNRIRNFRAGSHFGQMELIADLTEFHRDSPL